MDFVLVIRGQFLSLPVLDYMKKHFHSGCRYIFYQWDSVRNNPNALEIADFFDLRFTFDPIDAKKYNIVSDRQFALDVLHAAQVLFVPGSGFDWPTPDHFRLVMLPEPNEISRVVSDIAKFLETYDQSAKDIVI